MQFRIGEIDARAHPRALGEGKELTPHLLRVVCGICKPALGSECLGVYEGVRVLVIDVGARRDNSLQREHGQWVSIAQRAGSCTPAGIFRPQKTAPEEGTTRGRCPGVP